MVLCSCRFANINGLDFKDLDVEGAFYVRKSSPEVLESLVLMLQKMLQNFAPLSSIHGILDKTIPELIALISWKSGHLLEYLEECIDEDVQAAHARYQERHNLLQKKGLVFHGTSKSASDGILDVGFKKTEKARGKWGEGTYVTTHINEAWRYTAELKGMTVLICYMHVGKTAVGSQGQTEFVDSSDPTMPAVHTLTSKCKRILVGSGEEGQISIVARSSWRFVPPLMSPATLQAIGGGNNQVNAEYRRYLATLPAAVKLDIQPWPDVSAYNRNEQVYAVLPDRPQIVGAGGAAAAAAAPVGAAAAAAAGAVATAQASAGRAVNNNAVLQVQAAAAAAGAAGTQSNSKKRGGGHVAGSAVQAPKRKAPKLETFHYAHIELPGLKVGDRVQIKKVFKPYRRAGYLIDAFGCVRAIGQNCTRTIVLVEMENQLQADWVKSINNVKNGILKSAFPYVTWSDTEQQEDHLLAVRPKDVVRV